MKVFTVRRGCDNPDESPSLKRIFAERNDAVTFIEKDVQENLKEEKQTWHDARIAQSGPDYWLVEILSDSFWLRWSPDQVWILEEYEVE